MEKLIDYILSDKFERVFSPIVFTFIMVVGTLYIIRLIFFLLDFIALS